MIYLPSLEIRTTKADNGSGINTLEELHVIDVGGSGRAQVRALHWESGQPADIAANQLRFSIDNQIGSSLLELDAEANILTEEEYYPFGGTALQAAANGSEVKYKFIRYSGKERDNTGLYYYGYRYYMSWAGR